MTSDELPEPVRSDHHRPVFRSLHHVQLAMPLDGETAAVEFYQKILGIPRVEKPAHLEARGGCWFEDASVRIHLGVDPEFKAAKKAHPALVIDDLSALRAILEASGVEVVVDQPLPGFNRFYVSDPFGNRLEFLEPS
jgi:catechol 2,3-dioxygenase-like lactoylglutathione lyase family enzyme